MMVKMRNFPIRELEDSLARSCNSSGVVVNSLQVGDCWVWSLIIFLIPKVLFQLVLDPKPQWRDVEGISLPL